MIITPLEGAAATVGVVSITALSLTPSDVNTAIIGLTGLVTAVGILIVNVMHARAEAKRQATMEAKADETAAKADAIVITTAEIKELTNSTNSNLQKALELMTEKYSGSQRALAQAQETKRDVAAAQVVADLKHAIASPPPGSPLATTPILESIDQNTDATAKNTARTEAVVETLKKES